MFAPPANIRPIEPVLSGFAGQKAILDLGDEFFDRVTPATFPQLLLRFRNDRAAASIALDSLSDADWLRHFGRFEPLPDSLETPLALRYHGHQFRTYNPDLGDGRGFLFAQCLDDCGRLMDLGTKGSGTTPWSRAGDGRLTLKGAVREILATEMLAALGVDTSRTLSVVETGEALDRSDEPSPTRGAVLVRLSHSHVRYGSFQRPAYGQDADAMARLVAYASRHFVPGGGDKGLVAGGDRDAAALLDHVVTTGSRLAAQYMAAGFVHGVLNTDNINVTGESFDYGPWRFAPAWDADFTAAYFDHHGLYSFGRQPEALQWNVYQLAGALRLVAPLEALKPALEAFGGRYQVALATAMLGRLGVASRGLEADTALVKAIEAALVGSRMDPDRFWFDWRHGVRRAASPADAVYEDADFAAFSALINDFAGALPTHDYWRDAGPCTMLIDEVEAIWAPIAADDDWSALHTKVAAIRRMGAAMA